MTWWRTVRIGAVAALALGLVPGPLWADSTQLSPSFSINESQVGGIGDFKGTSPNYSFVPGVDDGGATLGDTFAGNSASTNYQSNAGFNTTAQPFLSFAVTSGSINLGVLSTSAVSTGTATFRVKNYTSSGYVVQAVGTALKSGAKTILGSVSDSASIVGTEQFGLNTVLNSVAGIGANPVQVPGSSFSYGVAGDGANGTYGTTRPYTISDKWRFVSGETIASAPKSSGETDFTATFMANIAPSTPGGTYQADLTFVATGTY